MRDGNALGAAGVTTLALVYFILFCGYGLQLEDEGTLLFQLDRVVSGQVPYRDFHTGYTPGYFYLLGLFLKCTGESVLSLRLLLAAVNATSAALIYVLARRISGRVIALLAAAAWVSFLPIYPGEFASFNVPYPAWLVIPCWLGLVWCLHRWCTGGALRYTVAAGFLAGLAFALKPNAGAFAVTAVVTAIALTSRLERMVDRVALAIAVTVSAAGTVLAFSKAWHVSDALVHLSPFVALLALILFRIVRPVPACSRGRALDGLIAVVFGFVVPTALWLLPALRLLGWHALAREVLFVGSPAAQVYYRGYPALEPYALVLVGGALGFSALCWLAKQRPGSATTMVGVPLGLGALTVLVVSLRAPMPESFTASVLYQLENAAFLLVPVAHWAGIGWILRASSQAADRGRDVGFLLVAVPAAVAMFWQMYPRSDFMHLVFSTPLSLVVVAGLTARLSGWLSEAGWSPGSVGGETARIAAVATALALVLMRTGPAVAAAVASYTEPAAILRTPRLSIRVEPAAGDDVTALAATVNYLTSHTDAGEEVLAFPAAAVVLFASERRSPVPHDYWFAGRPDHSAEHAMVEKLEALPPRFVVVLNEGSPFFVSAPGYYRRLRGFVVGGYRLVARAGRFDVLARKELAVTLGPPAIERVAPAAMADLIEPNLARRRQAARRWVANLRPKETTTAALPAATGEAILLLRAIRDGGDMRAAAWLAAGYRSDNERVRRAAIEAMAQVSSRFLARRLRWAADFDAADLARYLRPLGADVGSLVGADDPEVRRFAGALLAVISARE